MSSYTPNLLRDEMCESRRKMERPIEIQRHLVCAARKMTKALPPVISFASFHPLIIAVSFSLVVPVPFSPPSRSLFLAFSAASSQYFILPLLPSFLQLFLSSLMTFFVPLLPPSSSHPLSSPPSPIPHLKTSTLRRLLIFLPPPSTTTTTISHIMYTQSTSQLLCFFAFPASLLPCLLPGVL